MLLLWTRQQKRRVRDRRSGKNEEIKTMKNLSTANMPSKLSADNFPSHPGQIHLIAITLPKLKTDQNGTTYAMGQYCLMIA